MYRRFQDPASPFVSSFRLVALAMLGFFAGSFRASAEERGVAPVADSDSTEGFRPIFDGRTLDGWSAPDPRYWSVEDGAITGRSTPELPCDTNQFLAWTLGELDDFELRFEFRILGSESANSGVQIRAEIAPDGHAVGYQADMDRAGPWLGALYDEHTRRTLLAKRGERVAIAPDGTREAEALPVDGFSFDGEGWNRYRIVARGERITIEVNGVVTSDVTDREKGERDLQGRLALQLHAGPPTTVQFRKVELRRLPLDGGRKKLVLIAGRPSHPSGQHEFNAGIALLARRLARLEDRVIAASYHDGGWPKDPTAFDNANAVVVYSDGEGSHPFRGHFDEVDALAKRGAGILCMHYAVHVDPGEEGDAFKRWIGGHYESGFSTNPHWTAALDVDHKHPIGRGVDPASIHDEWYFSIRFCDDEASVVPVFRAKPDEKARARNGYPPRPYQHIIDQAGRAETLLWAVERDDGGRGVGFTGGHWHRNWAIDTQRRTILNAMLWVAGAEVPEGGVDSEPVSEEELNSNLDRKNPMVHVELPEGAEKPPKE